MLRVGEYVRTINAPGAPGPGLHIKAPFIDSVVFYDNRNMGLPIEGQSIVASDQERLIVDAVLRWRIVDPRLFYQGALTESIGANRLRSRAESALRGALGGATSNEIISGRARV
ncbi:MAG: SPFH domain-containing protein [Terricaulis sp.]